jgi:tetratricopeptide (TPR) repeat protein
MKKFFMKYRIIIFFAVLLLIPISVFLFMSREHYNIASTETCQNCHLKDGDLVFVNTGLKVKYTGTESCQECHQEAYEAYMKSPTGHSMGRLTENNIIEKFPQDYVVYDSTKNYYYEMLKKDGKFYQREYRLDPNGNVVHERLMEAQYIIGSGSNLRIYFYDENGMFYELPLTWYVHKQKWDLSPGYREFDNNRFSRYVSSMCFSCHNGNMAKLENANNRYKKPYKLGIGCEDCHGPGEIHIKQTKEKELNDLPDFVKTIVNPASLSPERRNDVCLQCHIEGKSWALQDKKTWFDFRPGLLLTDQRSVYASLKQTTSSFNVANTGSRLFMSPCFDASHGQLTCDFCHSSHNVIEVDKVKNNRQSCMRCHPIEGLPMREARLGESREDCNRCHMKKAPANNTLHGVVDTDHWIRINSDWDKLDWYSERKHVEKLILTPIIDNKDSSSDIRQGIAYSEYYFTEEREKYYLDSAFYYLKKGLNKNTSSIYGNYYLGRIEGERKNYKEALNYLNNSINLDPEYSYAFYELAKIYKKQRDYKSAISSIKEAINYKNAEPTYLELLGTLYYETDSVKQAVDVLNRSIKIDSQNPNVFFILGNIYIFKLNDYQKALGYYKKAVLLDPDLPNALINLGNTYALLGQFDKAIESYKKEILFRKNSARAYANLGKIYKMQGKLKEAFGLLRKAKLIDPRISY